MCTALTYQTRSHYFGRNLDLEHTYGEAVTITPRLFPLPFRRVRDLPRHYAMIGVAHVADGYPLYYDATNEKGLSMAGLNFPGNACYFPPAPDRDNISPFELIPWILGQCSSLNEVYPLLERIHLAAIPFSAQLPLSPLHWIISDENRSITVESVKDGLKIYDNPVGVLTNNPPFDFHMTNLNHYMSLSIDSPDNRFSSQIPLTPFSRGMGAIGLPGDLSSSSRFIKAAFTKLNSVSGSSESESISQFFHVLSGVAQQRGCVRMPDGTYEITIYSSCCNTCKGIYYYTTYENSQITAVDMNRENLDGDTLVSYALAQGQKIFLQN